MLTNHRVQDIYEIHVNVFHYYFICSCLLVHALGCMNNYVGIDLQGGGGVMHVHVQHM